MRIGVFCSGGDAPGMNACVRAVVRSAIANGHDVVGIQRGYQGLLNEDFYVDADGEPLMKLRSVSNLCKVGGTILHTSRSDEFRTEAGQKKAAAILLKHRIDALVPIGGDGTFHGAVALSQYYHGQIIGCPGTIDNDLLGTDYTIGFATAVETAVEALDRLRDTAESHERMFIVEVMGRHSGYIGLYTAIGGGAEVAALPETPTDTEQIIRHLQVLKARGKKSIMIVVAEGDEAGGAAVLNESLKKAGCPFQTRVLTLGHLQRGGSPVAADRILASRLGDFAVRSLLEGHTGAMAGSVHGELVLTPFADTVACHRPVPESLLRLLDTLAY
ncbi:MAG: ATP-dependent 6-phosphofructokinase [Patescibacteria group bacterium]|nr:ATP-dependent 6-phosphofructokinase [Patescibacteria group bacterium]